MLEMWSGSPAARRSSSTAFSRSGVLGRSGTSDEIARVDDATALLSPEAPPWARLSTSISLVTRDSRSSTWASSTCLVRISALSASA
jgi:hypothetical protein